MVVQPTLSSRLCSLEHSFAVWLEMVVVTIESRSVFGSCTASASSRSNISLLPRCREPRLSVAKRSCTSFDTSLWDLFRSVLHGVEKLRA